MTLESVQLGRHFQSVLLQSCKLKYNSLSLVQMAAETSASTENACVWRRQLQKIRKIRIREKKKLQQAASEKYFIVSWGRVNEPL